MSTLQDQRAFDQTESNCLNREQALRKVDSYRSVPGMVFNGFGLLLFAKILKISLKSSVRLYRFQILIFGMPGRGPFWKLAGATNLEKITH